MKIMEFTKSIRQLEAPPDRDDIGWHQAEAALHRARTNPNLKENAICGMAWLHLKRGNTEAVGNLLGKLGSVFPAPSPSCYIATSVSQRFKPLHRRTLEPSRQCNRSRDGMD